MARRKDIPIIENFEITGVAAEGKAIGRWNDLVVFIPFGAPGDIIDLKIIKKRHSYADGRIERMVTPSPIRVQPQCPHFGVCGGCKWQHLPYSLQLQTKQQQVADALQRIAKVELPPINAIIGSEHTFQYRNKLEFTFSNRAWLTAEQLQADITYNDRNALGFHIPRGFDKVLDIKQCLLQDDISNQIRLFVRQYAIERGYSFYNIRDNVGLMRTLMIRVASTGQIMVVVVFSQDDPDEINDILSAIQKQFPQITSLMYAINLKCNDTLTDQTIHLFAGTDYIEERMEDLTFRVSPKSFYQTNSLQALQLYKVARRMAALTGTELVYDLYTGTGTIVNFVARQARHVIGIEYVPEAIDDARLNSNVNHIDNTTFFAGDMKNVLTDHFITQHGRPDVIIIDPPRAGMHPDVVKVVDNAAPQRIVYVSCNPATQARDIAMLDQHYKVAEIQPVDMFPHTHHVENVALLIRRQN